MGARYTGLVSCSYPGLVSRHDKTAKVVDTSRDYWPPTRYGGKGPKNNCKGVVRMVVPYNGSTIRLVTYSTRAKTGGGKKRQIITLIVSSPPIQLSVHMARARKNTKITSTISIWLIWDMLTLGVLFLSGNQLH